MASAHFFIELTSDIVPSEKMKDMNMVLSTTSSCVCWPFQEFSFIQPYYTVNLMQDYFIKRNNVVNTNSSFFTVLEIRHFLRHTARKSSTTLLPTIRAYHTSVI